MPICPKCEDVNPQLGAKCPRDGYYYVYDEAFQLAQTDPRIGTLAADKYVIIGRISKGGMGAVYRAMQLPVEREVAFKVLRAEMEGSSQGRDRFIREARAVSRLTHPNIITLHDFGFDVEGHPYMVMEYAPGQDMSRWLRRKDLTTERILHVIRQLLSALDAAHLQGIVHRDLKPENMIVTSTSSDQDFVKLLDFGIARMINETSTRGLTREGEVFGTPHYMAPEQAQGAKEVGPAADVYAVGVMLFELLTGEPPFDAPTPLAVLMQHISEPLPPIHARPGVVMTDDLDALVRRAAAKTVEERFQNAGEMLYAIDQLIAHYGLHHTGAYLSVPRADLTGEHSRPGAPTASFGNHEQVTHAPTLAGTPQITRIPARPHAISVHDPEPSELIHVSQIRPEDESFDTLPTAAPRADNRKAVFALVGLIALLLIAGSVAIALSTSDSHAKSEEPLANNAPATPDEVARTQQEPAQRDPVEASPPAVIEQPEAPDLGQPGSLPTDVVAPADPPPEVNVEPTPPDTTPDPVEPTPIKKRTPKESGKDSGVKKTPEPEPKPVEKKKPEVVKELWGAPAEKTNKKDTIQPDKW